MAAATAWGVPYAVWWTLYDNTRVFLNNGTDKSLLGVYQDRGFCLVDHDNKASVLYSSINQYMNQADEWLCQQLKVNQGRLLN